MFRPIDREARIYQRVPIADEIRMTPRIGPPSFGLELLPTRTPSPLRAANEAAAHREALERFAPPSVVVDESYRVLHLSELAGRYLQPSGGTLVNDVTELAREELRFDLRAALHRAFSRNEPSLSGPIAVRFNGAARRVYLQAKPLSADPNAARSAIVFFFEGEALGDPATAPARSRSTRRSSRSSSSSSELQFTQSQLGTSREEYEGANEELRAANEELQSINEEYRSTAEELETSKEELQSINEELQTVNSELKSKLDSVSRAHSDIQNLMAATDVGILFLDTQLRIKRFTPRIAELFNIAAGDEGRSITDFTHSLDYGDIAKDARAVLRDLASREREVRSRSGSWYLMRHAALPDGRGQDRRRRRDLRRHRRAASGRGRAAGQRSPDAGGDRRRGRLDRHHRRSRDHPVAERGHDPHVRLFGGRTHRAQRQRPRARARLFAARRLHPALSRDRRRRRSSASAARSRRRRKDGSTFPGRTDGLRNPPRRRAAVHRLRARSQRAAPVRGAAQPAARQPHRLDGGHGDRLGARAQPAARGGCELSLHRAPSARREAEPADAAVNDALDKASSQMHRAGQIIAHLREFMARGEPDKMEQSLHDLIRRTCELVAPSARQAGVEIVLHLDAAEDKVLADRVQIEQAMVNLVRNAIEAMSDAPERKLTISTALEDGMIRADFSDTGHGLPAKAGVELFVPFTSTKSSGLGVGLSISRSIVEAHYGTIWAEANPGGGAKFCFTLPLARLESRDRERDAERLASAQ